MAAFSDYYVPKVEEFLGRTLTEDEIKTTKALYVESWHPKRVANYILGEPENYDNPAASPLNVDQDDQN